MLKRTFAVLILALASLVPAASTSGQQSPASGTQQTPGEQSQKPPAAKTTPKPAAKISTPTAKPLTLTTDKDKESYALGMNIARGMKAQSIDVDPAILASAIRDVLSGAKPLLSDEQEMAELKQLQTEARARQIKEGQDFLAANKTKEGVVALPDGLQYKILTEGTGPKPTANDTVVCQYRGTLIDGTEFDSSYKRGQPATFPVGRVIKGWTQALQMMPVGSKWQLFIPPDLGYGERGAPGTAIGPNAVLVFEIDLQSIQPPNATPAQPSPPSQPPTSTK
jgi:FKBP-type peptidyl-prolyl cis-trans isomerase